MFDLDDLPPLLQRLRAAAGSRPGDEAAVETMAAAGALACWAEALALQAVAELRGRRQQVQGALASELGGWDAVADRGGPCDGDEVDRFTAVEVAAAMGLSTRTARDRVHLAVDVVQRQPALLAAMRAGVVGVPHARAVRDATEALADDVVAGAVVSGVLATRREAAERQGVPMRLGALGTPAELAAHVRRDAVRAGLDVAARCQTARARRRTSSWALPDGMAALQVTGPAVTIAAAVAEVDRRARDAVDAARAAAGVAAAAGAAGPGVEVPTLDQARADAVLQALTGSPDLERLPGRVGLDVTVLVPLEVLTAGAADAPARGGRLGPPAELPGLGPLPDPVARAVTAAARRVRVVVLDGEGHVATSCAQHVAPPAVSGSPPDTGSASDTGSAADTGSPPDTGSASDTGSPPDTGAPVGTGCPGDHPGADVYRPGAAVDRAVRARDLTCRWPGCRARAARCDLDHTVPFPDGPTSECNLVCLCRAHHRAKHRGGWLTRQGAYGRLDVTSPTGRIYVTEPATWHSRS